MMRNSLSVIAIAAIVAAANGPVMATDTPTTSMAMPKCATADQVVMVDTASKTYSIYEPSSNAKSRQEKSATEAKTDVSQLKSGMKPMCKSKADAMGAKMASGAMATPTPGATPAP